MPDLPPSPHGAPRLANSGRQNPSLTYMALSAPAAHHAAQFLKEGKL